MVEIISSIIEAEEKADEKVKGANLTAREMKVSCDNACEKIRFDAIDEFKKHRSLSIKQAEKNAEAEYDRQIKLGEDKASVCTKRAKENLIDAVNYIVEGILR